ncbi:MAG: hypothetical protein GY820_00745 [Gammaproteobacteria bacterium]|nr:hypothetical protein [Gammaproteobacteria bacterium]
MDTTGQSPVIKDLRCPIPWKRYWTLPVVILDTRSPGIRAYFYRAKKKKLARFLRRKRYRLNRTMQILRSGISVGSRKKA